MHVKYASRHVLYPVPNVLDVAARAGVRAARDADVVALRAVRDVLVAALRAVVGCAVDARAARDTDADVVALRVVAVRADVAVRVTVAPARDADAAALRVGADCADMAADCRATLVVSRTAALATPMPAAIVPTKSKNFFIFMIYIISKTSRHGN